MLKKLRTLLVLLPLAKQGWEWYTSRKHKNKQSRIGNGNSSGYWD